MRWCGSSDSCIQSMYRARYDTLFPNSKGRPLAVLARDMHIHQLFPGSNLQFLDKRFYENFNQRIRFESILADYRDRRMRAFDNEIVVPLNSWVSENFVKAGTDAYFGPRLLELDPHLVQTFLEFDDLSWQVLYQYPKVLAGKMYTARDRLTQAIEKYFQLEQDKRYGDAWFTKAMENDMRKIGIGNHDLATMMMTIHWG